jgi:hypothetical protein
MQHAQKITTFLDLEIRLRKLLNMLGSYCHDSKAIMTKEPKVLMGNQTIFVPKRNGFLFLLVLPFLVCILKNFLGELVSHYYWFYAFS